jgi:hypothetical protein
MRIKRKWKQSFPETLGHNKNYAEGKFVDTNAFIKKSERSPINSLPI